MKRFLFVAALIQTTFLSAQCFVQVICQGATCVGMCDGSATAYPGGGAPPYAYFWQPGLQTTQSITGLCEGTYTVTMTDSNGCWDTAYCTVAAPAQLQSITSVSWNPTCSTCCDGSVSGTHSGGMPPYYYMWYGPSGPINQVPSQYNLCNGTYTLCITDANGCNACDSVTISYGLSVASSGNESGFTVLPQSSGIFMANAVFNVATEGELVMTNIYGQVIRRQSFGSSSVLLTEIDLTDQPPGMYLVLVLTPQGTTSVRIIR